MFGNKKKKATYNLIDESPVLVMDSPNYSQTEKVFMQEETTLPEENKTSLMDDVSQILGKSPKALKEEFFRYQLEGLINKIGSMPNATVNSISKAEEFLLSSVRAGVKEFMLSPLELPVYRQVQKRNKLKGITFTVLSDGLKGEGSFKGKYHAVKWLSKSGADKIVCTFPARAEGFSLLGESKKRTVKTLKVSKKPVLLEVEYIEPLSFRKTLRAVDGLKAECFMLSANDLSFQDTQTAISLLGEFKGDKRIVVKSNLSSVEEFSALSRLGVAKIYTPNAKALCTELSKRLCDPSAIN